MMPKLPSRTPIVILFVVMLTYCTPIFSQIFTRSDIEIINSVNFDEGKFNEREFRFGLRKGAWLTNILFAPPLYVYQKYLSTQISAGCLYHPTCSEFSHRAFSHYRIPKALLSTMDRIMRCDRISATDFSRMHPSFTPTHRRIEDIDYYGDF